MQPNLTTQEARAQVLQDIRNGGSVPLGTCLAHAQTAREYTARVLWMDCSQLLIGELRTLRNSLPETVCQGGRYVPIAKAVRMTKVFHTAYEHVRYHVRLARENEIRAALGQDLIIGVPPEGPAPVDGLQLAAAVADELGL